HADCPVRAEIVLLTSEKKGLYMIKNLGTSSRRKFIERFSCGAMTPALLAQISTRDFKDAEDYWVFIRKQFLLEPGLTYLNVGTTGAMPRPVFEAEIRYQRMLAENPKVRHVFEYGVTPNVVRKKAAEVIGATLDETALTHNTTEGLNIVAHGL